MHLNLDVTLGGAVYIQTDNCLTHTITMETNSVTPGYWSVGSELIKAWMACNRLCVNEGTPCSGLWETCGGFGHTSWLSSGHLHVAATHNPKLSSPGDDKQQPRERKGWVNLRNPNTQRGTIHTAHFYDGKGLCVCYVCVCVCVCYVCVCYVCVCMCRLCVRVHVCVCGHPAHSLRSWQRNVLRTRTGQERETLQ